jgi:hypothetical protein
MAPNIPLGSRVAAECQPWQLILTADSMCQRPHSIGLKLQATYSVPVACLACKKTSVGIESYLREPWRYVGRRRAPTSHHPREGSNPSTLIETLCLALRLLADKYGGAHTGDAQLYLGRGPWSSNSLLTLT